MASPPDSPHQDGDDLDSVPAIIRQMTVKDLLSTIHKGKKRGTPMPSSVQREEERRMRRLEKRKKNSTQMESNEGTAANTTQNIRTDSIKEGGVEEPRPGLEMQNSTLAADPNEGAAAEKGLEEKDPVVMAPKVTIDEDGNIVIDKSSLVINAGDANMLEDCKPDTVTIDSNDATRHITSATYAKREPAQRWNKGENDKFYDALSRFGTDFSLIQHLFPTRSRRQIKLKFKREERENSAKVETFLKLRTQKNLVDTRKEFGFSTETFDHGAESTESPQSTTRIMSAAATAEVGQGIACVSAVVSPPSLTHSPVLEGDAVNPLVHAKENSSAMAHCDMEDRQSKDPDHYENNHDDDYDDDDDVDDANRDDDEISDAYQDNFTKNSNFAGRLASQPPLPVAVHLDDDDMELQHQQY